MSEGRASAGRAVSDIVLYVAARLALVVVLGAVIYALGRLAGVDDFPPTVAALLALIIAMPAGIWLFRPLRRRATASVAQVSERRRAERAQLRARLRGEESAERD